MRDRSFEQQFQWEVDRFVFRRSHGGEPIEVSREERDRLVGRHRRRMEIANRVMLVPIFLTAGVPIIWSKQAYYLGPMICGAIVFWVLVMRWWAYEAVTAHLAKRIPVGLRLGLSGQMARHAEAQRWPHLLLGLVLLVLIAWLTSDSLAGDRLSWITLVGFEAVLGLVFLWLLVLKWAQYERGRLHDEKVEAVRRARKLR